MHNRIVEVIFQRVVERELQVVRGISWINSEVWKPFPSNPVEMVKRICAEFRGNDLF